MKLSILKDIHNNPYIGIKFSFSDNTYKDVLKWHRKFVEHFGYENCKDWIANRVTRDGYDWHITVFNVMECNKSSRLQELITKIGEHGLVLDSNDIYFKGVGSISKNDLSTYYIVVQSSFLDHLRATYSECKRDFHVTLAFTKKDLFHSIKNETTIFELKENFSTKIEVPEYKTFESIKEYHYFLKTF